MRNMKRAGALLMALLLTISLSVAAAGCSRQKSGLTKVTLVFDWIPNTNYIGAYVAQAKGWFAAEGLDVEFRQAPDGSYIEMVGTGKGDFGYAAQESVSMAVSGENPMPVISVATVLQHNTSGFASPASRNIKEPKDFAGKRYSGWGTDIEKGIISAMMKAQDADPSTVKMLNLNATDFFASVEKDADFAWIYYGEDGVTAGERGYPINFIRLQDFDERLDFYTPVIIANKDTVKNDPELVRKFLRALSKGYTYAGKNPEEAADILTAAVPEIDRTHALDSIRYLAGEYFDAENRWGYMNQKIWSNFTGWLSEQKIIPGMPTLEELYTNEFLPK